MLRLRAGLGVCAILLAVMLTAGVASATSSTSTTCASGSCQTDSTAAVKTVTMQANRMAVIDAIDLLFKGSGYKYTILPGVEGTITIAMDHVPFAQAIKQFSDAAGLTYGVNNGRVIFGPKPQTQVAYSQPSGTTYQQAPEFTRPPVEAYQSNGPVFYGEPYGNPYGGYQVPAQPLLPLYPPYADIGNSQIYAPPPFTRPIIITGGAPINYRFPLTLPPPGLRPPSLQRMLDQMEAVQSYPGFAGPYFSPGY